MTVTGYKLHKSMFRVMSLITGLMAYDSIKYGESLGLRFIVVCMATGFYYVSLMSFETYNRNLKAFRKAFKR